MALISLYNASLAFGDAPLLDSAELHVQDNERLCLVGRNGAGKSSLLKIINQEIVLDDGSVVYQPGVRAARLQQEPPRDIAGSTYDFVAGGLTEQSRYLQRYHQLISQPLHSDQQFAELANIQEQLEHHGLWQLENRIAGLLSQLGLAADVPLASLSGGWMRKAALGRALVSEPQVLLLDEPTNHLDIGTIQWLEDFLKNFQGSLVFISHDRSFIRHMATRIVDLDRGKLVSYPGDYDRYLQAKATALQVEEAQNAEFDRKLALEEQWIRQGIKARRTRNEGRVRALHSLRQQRCQRREVQGTVSIQAVQGERSGKIVFELEQVSYQIDQRLLVSQFSAQVQRGDRIALVGTNGCGKTTLLKLMLGELQAQSGRIQRGSKLEIAYFDQHRLVLQPEKSVIDNLAEGKQEVVINGKSRHVFSYLQDFLFPPKRAMTPVSALSGGERSRLLLARLFLQPGNVLILDEPTNDLDVETLELLEELIADYQGTVLLVSHDRQFVDNTVTECWMFEGDGLIRRYPGGYHDARRQQQTSQPLQAATVTAKKISNKKIADKKSANNREPVTSEQVNGTKKGKAASYKLSYNEQRELAQLPQRMEAMEAELEQLKTQISDKAFYQQPYDVTHATLTQLAALEQQLEQAFSRWEYLETVNQRH